jgi:hypothetical protein
MHLGTRTKRGKNWRLTLKQTDGKQRVTDEELANYIECCELTDNDKTIKYRIATNLRDARAENDSLKECVRQKDVALKSCVTNLEEYADIDSSASSDGGGCFVDPHAYVKDAVAKGKDALALTPATVVDTSKAMREALEAFRMPKTMKEYCIKYGLRIVLTDDDAPRGLNDLWRDEILRHVFASDAGKEAEGAQKGDEGK